MPLYFLKRNSKTNKIHSKSEVTDSKVDASEHDRQN